MYDRKHYKGLRLLVEANNPLKLTPHIVERIREILSLLETAKTVEQTDMPGYQFHKLTGKEKDLYSVKVNANFRIIFRLEDGNAYDVDFLDYH